MWQVRIRDRPQRGEALAPELEQRHRVVEILEPMLAELGQLAIDERPRRCGYDDLTAVAGSGNAGGTVQLATGVALAGQLQLARVHPHPYLDLDGRERILTLRRSGQRLGRIGERVQECVPLRVDLDATVLGKNAP